MIFIHVIGKSQHVTSVDKVTGKSKWLDEQVDVQVDVKVRNPITIFQNKEKNTTKLKIKGKVKKITTLCETKKHDTKWAIIARSLDYKECLHVICIISFDPSRAIATKSLCFSPCLLCVYKVHVKEDIIHVSSSYT